MKMVFDSEKKEMQNHIDQIEIENKKLLDTLIRHSKNKEENILRSPKVKENYQAQNIKPVL
jgi:hypothetical protein